MSWIQLIAVVELQSLWLIRTRGRVFLEKTERERGDLHEKETHASLLQIRRANSTLIPGFGFASNCKKLEVLERNKNFLLSPYAYLWPAYLKVYVCKMEDEGGSDDDDDYTHRRVSLLKKYFEKIQSKCHTVHISFLVKIFSSWLQNQQS